MNYYEHHIGDYAAATSHLTLVEDAIYSRLLRRYYVEEAPLPTDVAKVARMAGARSDDEVASTKAILEEFFFLMEDGWHNKRADAEIAHVREKKGKAAASANERWERERARVALEKHTDEIRDAELMRTHSERTAHQSPVTSHQSPKEDQEIFVLSDKPTRTTKPDIPYQEILDCFGALLPGLAQPRVLNGKRKRLIKSVWDSLPEAHRKVGLFKAVFAECADDPWLNGTGPYGDNHGNWRPTLDFIVREDQFTKVYEKLAARKRAEKGVNGNAAH